MGVTCSSCSLAGECVVSTNPSGSVFFESTQASVGQPDNLLFASEHYGGLWVQQLRDAARTSRQFVDMIMIGDFGVDVDDEKALCLAVAMQRIGVVHHMSVIANTGDSRMRARLAKGTLQALGAGEVPVAAGVSGRSLGGNGDFEFDCRYLASEDALDPCGGHELIFTTLDNASKDGRQVCIVLNSALSDMHDVLEDTRWKTLRHAVNNVTVMGGATSKAGTLVMDPLASNNFIDLAAASAVYERLSREVPFFVVSRHAAAQVQLVTSIFHGSLHPVAQRLVQVALKSTQDFWKRLHVSAEERTSGSLPSRCDRKWFYKTFLQPSTPQSLGPLDNVSPYLRGLNVYDGLTTVVSVFASLDQVNERFDIISCREGTTKLVGLDEMNHGIPHAMHINKLVLDLLVMVMGGGNGSWWRQMSHVAQMGRPVDLIMIGDFGKDLDDEKALCVAVAMRRLGLVGHINVIANLGCSIPRGRLAKGTLHALGADDCPVAAGSHGGQPCEELYNHEFQHAQYLASADDLDHRGATDLVFSVLREAKAAQRNICFALNSALTDMAAVLEDPRWGAHREVVSAIAAMGGVNQQEDGALVMDPTAANNAFDLPSAERVYTTLQSKEKRNPPFIVVSRHAASSCQMPRSALHGSKHPVALRFVGVSEPALQKLWERCFRSKAEREAAHDSLPMRCDETWFRTTFLEASAPSSLEASHIIWPFVKGFNEYDALTTIAVVAACHPPLFNGFFAPVSCPRSNLMVIGVDANRSSIVDPHCASELLHDCLVSVFERRQFQVGHTLEYRVDGCWQKICLMSRARESGPDAWLVIFGSMSVYTEVYLPGALQNVTWRTTSQGGYGQDEPVLREEKTTVRFRWIANKQGFPLFSHAAWSLMREKFIPHAGDVFITGPLGCGRTPIQIIALSLKLGRVEDVDLSQPYAIEISMARGTLDLERLRSLPPQHRVFKMRMSGPEMACSMERGLPPGLKVIYCMRDPRDLAARNFQTCKIWADDANQVTWPAYLDFWFRGEMEGVTGCDWLRSTLHFFELSKNYPDQVLILSFEDFQRDMEGFVRDVCKFLDFSLSDSMLQSFLQVLPFSDTKRLYGEQLGPLLRDGVVGKYINFFSPEELVRFRKQFIDPARRAGVDLPSEYLED